MSRRDETAADDDASTGGHATEGVGGFEYEVKVLAGNDPDGSARLFYDLVDLGQGEGSFDRDWQRLEDSSDQIQARSDQIAATVSRFESSGREVRVSIPSVELGVQAGDSIRLRVMQILAGPRTTDDFLDEIFVELY